jgi:predicted peptidase
MAQKNGRLVKEIKKRVNLNYLVYLPDKMEDEHKLPLILFLHGLDQRGEDLELLKIRALPKFLEKTNDFPFIVVSPQCPKNSYWNMESDRVVALLDEIISLYPVDEKRIYLTGLSMGGYGAWDLAIKYPQRFAALATVCSGGVAEKAHEIKKLPVWAFHGAKDDIVPVQDTLDMVEAVKQCGGNIKLTVYPHAEHDCWTQTYNNPLLYEWFLQHEINNTITLIQP